jgi:hypothetical protein
MKKFLLANAALFALLTIFSGCQVIGDIFKTGVGVGIFITVAIIIIVILVISKAGGNK